MPAHPRFRPEPRDATSRRKPLDRVQKMDHYRATQGPKIRQYYCAGDPIRDMQSSTNIARFCLVVFGLLGVMFLVMMVVKRT